MLIWTLTQIQFCHIRVFIFFGYPSRDGIEGSHGSSVFSFLRNLCTIFHSGSTKLHSNQECRPVLFSSLLLQHVLFVDFWRMTILTCVRWYLIVVLICISLVIINIEHLYMHLVAFCMSFLEKCLLRSSAHILIGLFILFYFDIELYKLFWKLNSVGHIVCKYFLPFHRLYFCFVDDFLCYTKAFKLD